MRTAVVLVVALLVVAACTSFAPVAIKSGDICEACRRPIVNTKIAAEAVSPNGLATKFRTVTCMASYLSRHEQEPGALFVTDYSTGRLIRAQSAVFVRGEIDPNTKEVDYYAFGGIQPAVNFGKENGSSPVDWPGVLQRVAASN